MRLELYTSGCCGSAKDGRLAGCGVVLWSFDGSNVRRRRAMAFGLGKMTLNLAALQAARLALAAIRDELTPAEIWLQTDNQYVYSLLVKDSSGYKIKPRVNQAEVASLRDLADKFTLIVPRYSAYDQADATGYECVLQARKAAATQKDFDSGTEEVK